jgi:hypothetical protein
MIMMVLPAVAQDYQRRAVLKGGDPNRGKCTIEVVVDITAEVEIRGDEANLRTLAGQPAQWRRFECSAPMPFNPANFRFAGVDGRGRQQLVRPPQNGGPAVVRIDDPASGSEGYTFDIFWSGDNGGPGFRPDRQDGGFNRSFATEDAVRVCRESVRQQATDRFRTSNIEFRRIAIDDNPGRREWVVGVIEVRRGGDHAEAFNFSCSVDFGSGRVRSAEIQPMGGDSRPGPREGYGSPANRAMQSCQRGVEDRLRRDGYERIEFRSINVDDRPGRNDWIVGDARAERRDGPRAFEFSCSVDLRDGDVRSVDVRPRDDRR